MYAVILVFIILNGKPQTLQVLFVAAFEKESCTLVRRGGHRAPHHHLLDSGPPVVRYKHRSLNQLEISQNPHLFFNRRSGRYICFSRKGRLRTWVSLNSHISLWLDVQCLFSVMGVIQSWGLNFSPTKYWDIILDWYGVCSDEAFSGVFVNLLSSLPCQTSSRPTVLIPCFG